MFRRVVGTAGLSLLLLSVVVVGPAPAVGQGLTQSPPTATTTAPDLEDAYRALWKKIVATGALGIYPAGGGTAVVVVPQSGSSSFTPADAAALGIQVTLETSPLEPAEVAAMKADGKKLMVSVSFDPRIGKVVIGSDDAAIGRKFDEQYPGKTEFILESAADPFASRHTDWSAHWGGAEMYGSHITCTSGFSVLNSSGKQRMVTAGHCFPLSSTVVSPGGDSFGYVTTRIFSASSDMDTEVVGGTVGVSDGPEIYRGGATGYEADVQEASDPAPGYEYCESGIRRTEQCNQSIQDPDFYWCDAGQTPCLDHMMKLYGPAVCHGDSGAPLFKIRSDGVAIRGTVSGFTTVPEDLQDYEGCMPLGSSWYNVIEPWTRIRDALNVTIMTAP